MEQYGILSIDAEVRMEICSSCRTQSRGNMVNCKKKKKSIYIYIQLNGKKKYFELEKYFGKVG